MNLLIAWRGATCGLYHILEQKHNHYVIIKVHKQSQFIYQAETVADSSLTPNVALLVHLQRHCILHSGLS